MNETTFGIIPIQKKDGKNLFLLIKSRQGNWGFPKGHPNQNESPIVTARRELEEETGLCDLTVLPQTFSEARVHVEPEYTVTKIVIWFIGIITPPCEVHVKDIDEIEEYKWVTFDDAHALLTHDETKRVLLDTKLYLDEEESRSKNEVDFQFPPQNISLEGEINN